MTIDIKCVVCKNPDRRRLIELGWNGGMSAEALARTLDAPAPAITRHLKEHAAGAVTRQIEVEPELPARERVLALQRLQLDEVERRIALARQRADEMNAALDERVRIGVEGAAEAPRHDWSEFFDILGRDGQAAIGSILKVTALEDRKAAKTADLKLGLFEAMSKAGLAPKGISGTKARIALPSGEEPDDEEA